MPGERTISDASEWTFGNNYDDKTAILTKGADAILVSELFKHLGCWDYSRKLNEVKKKALETEIEKKATQARDSHEQKNARG